MALGKFNSSLCDDPKMQVRSPMAEGVCDERNDDVEYMMSTCRKARPVAYYTFSLTHKTIDSINCAQ
jgi:hypothetical protein